MAQWNLVAGWTGMIFGLLSGAAVGLFFHHESFAGGYASFRRRMMRLGHIAFFGLGILNVIYSLTLISTGVVLGYPGVASISLIAAAILMPVVCFLSAWKKSFRHLFALPVFCVAFTLLHLLDGLLPT
jgi:hypothetical protein